MAFINPFARSDEYDQSLDKCISRPYTITRPIDPDQSSLKARENEAWSKPNGGITRPIDQDQSSLKARENEAWSKLNGRVSGDNTNELVFGTTSGEVTWCRRQGTGRRNTEYQEIIHPSTLDTRSSGDGCPGDQENTFQCGDGGYRDNDYSACIRRDVQVSSNDSMLSDMIRSNLDGLVSSGRRPESGPLELEDVGYHVKRVPRVRGASSYRFDLDSRYAHAGANLRDLPRNRDVGRNFSPDMPSQHGPYHQTLHITMKPPTFVGTTDLSSYLTQFQMICDLNEWSMEKRALQLAISLQGSAAEILNDMPPHCRKDYDLIAETLVQRFQPLN